MAMNFTEIYVSWVFVQNLGYKIRLVCWGRPLEGRIFYAMLVDAHAARVLFYVSSKPQGIRNLGDQATISCCWLIAKAVWPVTVKVQEHFNRGKPQINPVLVPFLMSIITDFQAFGQIAEHPDVVERVDIAADQIGNLQHSCALNGICG